MFRKPAERRVFCFRTTACTAHRSRRRPATPSRRSNETGRRSAPSLEL